MASLIITHSHVQITEIIWFGSVCAHTCQEKSIGRRASLRRPAGFSVHHRALCLPIARTFAISAKSGIRGVSLQNEEVQLKDSPDTLFSSLHLHRRVFRGNRCLFSCWALTGVCGHCLGLKLISKAGTCSLWVKGDLDINQWLQVVWNAISWMAKRVWKKYEASRRIEWHTRCTAAWCWSMLRCPSRAS